MIETIRKLGNLLGLNPSARSTLGTDEKPKTVYRSQESMKEDHSKLWCRNESDRRAIKNGCWFDLECGAYVVWWIETYLRLYEGEYAGDPVWLRGGHEETLDFDWRELPDDWDAAKDLSIQRALAYQDWVKAGNVPDWQYEATMQIFGWQRFSKRWKRNVRRFTASSIWISKKNKKTPTQAAWGCYVTFGDGEQGAKTFQNAKDGTQAGIGMAHAIAMVEQSPLLASECKINKNEKSITHIPTRSVFRPNSSSNARSMKSKEGQNGNMFVDEVHVVDRDPHATNQTGGYFTKRAIADRSKHGWNGHRQLRLRKTSLCAKSGGGSSGE